MNDKKLENESLAQKISLATTDALELSKLDPNILPVLDNLVTAWRKLAEQRFI